MTMHLVILAFALGGVLFCCLMLGIASIINPKKPNPEKLSTYECGEEALEMTKGNFNARYFILALIFLLFDVEVVMLFPWALAWVKETQMPLWFALGEGLLFVALLGFGLVYAWAKGYLEWVKPLPIVPVYKSPVPKSMYEAVNEKYK